MVLFHFIQGLLTEGKVSINAALSGFSEEDLSETGKLLEQVHQQDSLEMPGLAPGFSKEAALWAATRFYISVQMAVLREIDEAAISQQLKPYEEKITPEAIYSADLVLRYLPTLFELGKGFAPADILVEKLKQLAGQWPFSSVGIDPGEKANEDIIFANASLKQAYLDRVIAHKDAYRINNQQIQDYIKESTGGYAEMLWPGLDSVLKNKVWNQP
jgi:hypothetical protein